MVGGPTGREAVMAASSPELDVQQVSALEILDSRGNPTLRVSVTLADGTYAVAGVPSGASTGSREAVELRDGDPGRYGGKGVLGAVSNVNGELKDLLLSRSWSSLAEMDQAMCDADGTPNKSRLGDEGGFAPDITRPEDVLALLVKAIEAAGYTAGVAGVAIALDPAASEFYRDGAYHVAGETLTSGDMVERYAAMVRDYPVWSIEDGLAEGDWDGWADLTARLGATTQIVGDDLFVTNPEIIAEAIARGVGNSALIKLNQIGTVTETLEAMRLCREGGYTQMVSHRSGETEDSFIADLTVATGCGQLKSGAPARGERVAKYNRLLEIAAGHSLPYGVESRFTGAH